MKKANEILLVRHIRIVRTLYLISILAIITKVFCAFDMKAVQRK